jgi:hypothetical protein
MCMFRILVYSISFQFPKESVLAYQILLFGVGGESRQSPGAGIRDAGVA